jgi:hypothetical protein
MRRVLALVASAGLLLAVVGCGSQSYAKRLEITLNDMKYRKQLDDNLIPAPTKGKLEQLQIFVRPPKNMSGPAKEFLLTVLEPGKFDVSESFFEPGKQSLHVLARVKRPKVAPDKKKAAAPEPTNRGEFTPDVFAVLNPAYAVELDPAKLKNETKKPNTFRHLTFEGNNRVVQLYLYPSAASKTNMYEVALIFEAPKGVPLSREKVGLCLQSFAVGDKARRAFAGSVSQEELEGAGEAGKTF